MADDVVKTLIGLAVGSPTTSVRIEAIRSLATYIDDARVVDALSSLSTGSPTESVRIEAIKALGRRI